MSDFWSKSAWKFTTLEFSLLAHFYVLNFLAKKCFAHKIYKNFVCKKLRKKCVHTFLCTPLLKSGAAPRRAKRAF